MPMAAPPNGHRGYTQPLVANREERDANAASGLRWEGRWGVWHRDQGDCVYLFAPCIVELSIGRINDSNELGELLNDVKAALEEELSQESVVVSVVPSLNALGLQCGLRALLVCDSSVCKELSNRWQGRPFCSGRVSVSWAATMDTTTEDFVRRSQSAWTRCAEPGHPPHAVSLELPARWAVKDFEREGFPIGDSATLCLDAHWYQFATLFGEVTKVELAWKGSGANDARATVSLLVEFSTAASAKAMLELLHGRYLYNPLSHADFHAVVIACGSMTELRAQAQQQSPGGTTRPALTGPAYCIWRCDAGASTQPAEVWVTAQRPTVWIGRQGTGADLIVPFVHMSRRHAKVMLLPEADGHSPMILYIEDQSTNGTWVNDSKIVHGQKVRIGKDDRVSFQNESPDYPVYAIQYISNIELQFAAEKSSKRPRLEEGGGLELNS